MATVPWLLGWEYARLEDDLRKSFEVALHAGAVAAWLISPATVGANPLRTLRHPNRRETAFLLLSAGPPAFAGLAFERPIERRLGTPATIAVGLIVGALAMALADRGSELRDAAEAHNGDAMWLGVAQAAALVPGVSRSGATLAAARARGFTRPASRLLSARAGVPVIMGATCLKLIRTSQRASDERAWLATGAAASFLSTLLLAPMAARAQDRLSLGSFAAYRVILAGAVLARLRMGNGQPNAAGR